jgi:hypothetical protein
VIVPPRRMAVLSDEAATAPTQRDRHLQCSAEKGLMVWQKASGYNRRARVETAIGRWKQVIGDGLRSRLDECRASEVNVAVHVLNRMLELGRPSYAQPTRRRERQMLRFKSAPHAQRFLSIHSRI